MGVAMTELDVTLVARAVVRIRAHYAGDAELEPHRTAQAARLAGLERPLAATAMRVLEDEQFLVRNWSGRYLRRDRTLLQRLPVLGSTLGSNTSGMGSLPQPA